MHARLIAEWVEEILNVILVLALIVMVVCICAQVFGRYVLNATPPWTGELARFTMIWITMLASAAVIRRDGHVAVTALVDALPLPVAFLVHWLRDTLIVVMAGGLAWAGFGYAAIGARRDSPALEIPMLYPQTSIAVGATLIGLLTVLKRIGGAEADPERETD